MEINKLLELSEKELLKILLEETLKINQKLDKLIFKLAKDEPLKNDLKWDEEIPLKNRTDEVLAVCQIKGNEMNIHLTQMFPRNIPPFEGFLIKRILEPLKQKGVSYEIFESLSSIRDISVKNIDEKQKRELISATRWTLEKMWKKQGGGQNGAR